MTQTLADDATLRPSPGRWTLRFLWRFILVLLVLAVLLGLGIGYVMGRPITAPEWVQTRIEERLATEIPQADIAFGEMVFILDEGWRPRVRLRNVDVKTPEGTQIVAFTEVKSNFSMAALMRGQVAPRNLTLSGVFANLERRADGKVTLSGGSGVSGPKWQGDTLLSLIGQVDQVLQTPALEALQDVSLRALTLRFEDQRAGRAWTVDGGRLLLSREGADLRLTADLALLGGGADVATLAADYLSPIGQTEAEFGLAFSGIDARDVASQGPAFAWLSVLRAPISGTLRSELTATGALAPLQATLDIGAGVVQPNAQTKAIPFEGLNGAFSYDAQSHVLGVEALNVKSEWVSGTLAGEAVLNGVADGQLNDLVAQFRLRDLVANPGGFYSQSVQIEAADIDMQVLLDPFVLNLGQLQISDQGSTFALDGQLRADPAGWYAAIDGHLDTMTPQRVLALWPEALKPKTRDWLVANLYDAKISDANLAFRRQPDGKPDLYLAFNYTDAEVRFLKSFPPITKGQGYASLLDNRFVIALDKGILSAPEGGDISVTSSSFIMPDVTVKDGAPAVVRLNTESELEAVLSLLDQPPLNVMSKANLPVNLAKGLARLEGTLSFPLKKGAGLAGVEYHMSGQVRDVRSDTLVKNRVVTSPRLALVANNREVRITGSGRFDGVPFNGVWGQPIGAGSNRSKLTGQVDLTPEALAQFNITLPPGTLRGKGRGNLSLDFVRGQRPAYTLASNLRGLTLSVPQLSWRKPADTPGQFSVSGRLGNTPTVDGLRLEAAGLRALGSVTLKPGGGLDRVRFNQLALGNWLNTSVDLIGRGAGRAIGLAVKGGNLDLRRAQFGSGGGGGGGPAGPPMQVALDRLQITDTFALTNMTGQFTTGGGLSGPFQARLNGGTPVQGTVIPQGGRSAVRLISADAGGVLRSANLIKQVVGGALDLTLLPVGSGGAFDGRLKIKAVRVKDAPGIAALVNAISVVGLINELNGDGIYFDDVEAEFRLTPNQLTLTEASAVGTSLGVSMDGIFALQSGQIDMRGVVTPIYMLNGIGSVLTRKGEGLIGMNYTLTGAAKAPRVSVNPLSALAPGMFRDILRKAPPKLPEVEGVTGSTLPKKEPPKRKRPLSPEDFGR